MLLIVWQKHFATLDATKRETFNTLIQQCGWYAAVFP